MICARGFMPYSEQSMYIYMLVYKHPVFRTRGWPRQFIFFCLLLSLCLSAHPLDAAGQRQKFTHHSRRKHKADREP